MNDDREDDVETPGDVTPLGPAGVTLGESAIEMKQDIATKRAEATRKIAAVQAEVEKATADLERQRQAMEAEFRRRKAELDAQVAPLLAQVKQLTEMAWTVDLYLGRDEQLDLLRDGEPAAADVPITLRQMVLAMDEESLALVEYGGIDADRTGAFIDWLVADEEHLSRVIPEQKGVVVLVPSRQQRDYGDAFRNVAMDQRNNQSYWIIRNGQRVYQLIADIEVGSRLLPKRTEFVDFFYARTTFGGGSRTPLEPGSDAWLRAEEQADARRRHFMRIMLVLQGLVDRTVAFHPLPEGGVNFMDVAAQDQGKVVIINELDNVLTSGRESFRDWQQRLNSQLRPGMRIIGDFSGAQFRDTNEAWDRYSRDRPDPYRHSRLHPRTAKRPATNEVYVIEDRAPGGGLVIRYDRDEKVWKKDNWGREHQEEAKLRASCTLYPEDKFILPFDLATVAELETYLNARTERHAYLSMVPVIRAALAAKRTEEEQEAPFRQLLIGALLAANPDVDLAELEAAVPSLVMHYKLANRWARALVLPDPAEQGRAVDAIVREYAARRKAATVDANNDAKALAAAEKLPDVLAVGRRRDGTYTVYAASAPHQNVWLDEYRISKTGKVTETKRWTIPTGRSIAALTMLHTAPDWAEWNLRASRSEHISGPELTDFAETYLFPNAPGPAIALTHEDYEGKAATGWVQLYCWATPEGAKVATGEENSVTDLLVTVVARWKRDSRGAIVAVPESDHYDHRTGRRVRGNDWWIEDRVRFTSSAEIGRTSINTSIDWAGDHLRSPGMPQSDVADYRKRHRHDPSSPVLRWLDEDAWEDVQRAHLAIINRRKAERAERDRIAREAYRYSEPVAKLIRESIENDAKVRFFEDYGPDAEDLWPAHLASLKIADPIHQRTLWGIVAIALTYGHPVAGQTLGTLADYAWNEHENTSSIGEWHPEHRRLDMHGFDDLVIPEPDPTDDDETEE